jgi:hypothetical protein
MSGMPIGRSFPVAGITGIAGSPGRRVAGSPVDVRRRLLPERVILSEWIGRRTAELGQAAGRVER